MHVYMYAHVYTVLSSTGTSTTEHVRISGMPVYTVDARVYTRIAYVGTSTTLYAELKIDTQTQIIYQAAGCRAHVALVQQIMVAMHK